MKVVEGQLEFLQFVSDFSGVSNSLASESIRNYVSRVSDVQSSTPDVLPSRVDVRSTIDSATGKLISRMS